MVRLAKFRKELVFSHRDGYGRGYGDIGIPGRSPRLYWGTFTATRYYATTQTVQFNGATGIEQFIGGFILPANAINASLTPLMQFASTGPSSVAWNPASVGAGTIGDSMIVFAWGY